MGDSGDEGVRRLAHLVSPPAWGVIVAILGTLVFVPIGIELFDREHGNHWADAVMFLVGVWGTVALWRYLARPVRREDEADLFRMRRQRREP